MESWGKIAQRIYSLLKKNGHGDLVAQITDEYGIGGTPGEMFSIVCVWLAKMRNAKHEAYDFIKEDADKLLDYAVVLKYFTNKQLKQL